MVSSYDNGSKVSWLFSIFLPYAPRYARKSWMRINAFILAWTILSFIEILRTLEPEFRLYGTRSYIIYNTTVCFIWTIECLLHLLEYHHRQYYTHVPAVEATKGKQDNSQSAEKDDATTTSNAEEDRYEIYLVIIELMLAVYYSYDAVRTFAALWQKPNFNIESEVFEVLLDMVAYTYLTVRLRVYVNDKNEDSSTASPKSAPDEATAYVGMKDKEDETEV